jgi:hypothetical protein
MSGKKPTLRDHRKASFRPPDLRVGLSREARMCKTKHWYASKEDAMRWAVMHFRIPMRAYHCPYGDHWHLTKSL